MAGAACLALVTVLWLVLPVDDGAGADASSDGGSVHDVSGVAAGPNRPADTRLGVIPIAGAADARTAIARVVAATPDGAAGVSAVDMSTGATVAGGSTAPIWTASMYKLLVLETLLRQDGPLTGDRLQQATIMIEQSDNTAGYALFEDAGGNAALQGMMHALGMRDASTDDQDPTFTRLTATDAVQMVRALVRPGVLSAASRAQALGLMRNVIPGQRWGVGVVADPGTRFANKNGWLSVDDDNSSGLDDDGRWIVTTVGIVTVHGHQVLLAAMSEHNASEDDGITNVETLSRAAVALLGIPSPR